MNDNKKILLSIAMFILALCGNNSAAADNIFEIDKQMQNVYKKIETLRKQNEKQIHTALNKNDNYRYIAEHQYEIDSMRINNERLLQEAYKILRKRHPMTIIPCLPTIFTQYSKYHDINIKGIIYHSNLHTIETFDRKNAQLRLFKQQVKNHYDSIMYSELDKCYLMLDSLLRKKSEIKR